MDTKLDNSWYARLVDDVKCAWTEGNWSATEALLESRHEIGRRISEEAEKHDKSARQLIASVANSIGKKERSLYYAVALYKKWPKLEEAPFGKNSTYTSIVHDYLPAPKEKESEVKCKHCDKHCPK